MNDGKSIDQELADAVAKNRDFLRALDRMANHSQAWKVEDFRRFAMAYVSKSKVMPNG